jgi:hypothetical protein
VADSGKALGEHMQQISPNKLLAFQMHRFGTATINTRTLTI